MLTLTRYAGQSFIIKWEKYEKELILEDFNKRVAFCNYTPDFLTFTHSIEKDLHIGDVKNFKIFKVTTYWDRRGHIKFKFVADKDIKILRSEVASV